MGTSKPPKEALEHVGLLHNNTHHKAFTGSSLDLQTKKLLQDFSGEIRQYNQKNIIPSKVSKHCVSIDTWFFKVYDLYMPCWRRHVSAHLWTLSLQHGNLNTTSDEHLCPYKPLLFSSKRTVKKTGTSRTSTPGLQQRRLNRTKETEGKRRAPKDSRSHSWSKKANFREGIFFSTTEEK